MLLGWYLIQTIKWDISNMKIKSISILALIVHIVMNQTVMALKDDLKVDFYSISKNSTTRDLFDHKIFTHESIVEISGKKYRKIEYNSDKYYLQLVGEDSIDISSNFLCDDKIPKIENPRRLTVALNVVERTKFFIDGLQTACQQIHGQKMITVNPAIRIGFRLEDKPKDLIKNKTFYYIPFINIFGFAGDW